MRTKTAIFVCSALALALVLAFLMSPAGRARLGVTNHQADLVRAAGTASFRPSRLRLSIDKYRPAAPPVRGERHSASETAWKFRAIASDCKNEEQSTSSIAPLHMHGLALLLAGDAGGAVEVLKRATTRAASLGATPAETAALWNDLAVAYFERANAGDARKYVDALDAAEKAWAIDQSQAIAWTRGTLLEQLNLRNQAASAWAAYLKAEPDSDWSKELRARLSKEAGESASRSFNGAVHDKLIAACARGDIDVARAIVSAHPKDVRAIVEDELLGEWAAAAMRHSPDEAARLQTLRTLGLAFRQTSGDLLLADVVAFIDKNPARHDGTAGAIRHFAEGRAAYNKQIGLAERRLARAEEELRRVGCPLALLANVYRAAMVYASNRYADVAMILDAQGKSNAIAHYHALRGVRGWVTGLAYAQTGKPGASVDAYELALDGFRAAGEQENVAAVLHLRAETLDYMTATDEAWDDRMKGVAMFHGRSVSARPLVWMTVAMAAVRDHLEHAADAVLAEVAADAERHKDAMWLTEARMWRALARSRMGRPFTQSDIAAIRQSLRGIEDPALRSRSEANLHLVTAEIAFRTVPVPEIDKALNFYRSTDDQFNAMRALAFAAQKRAAASDFVAADSSLITALNELERQARDVDDPFMRALFAERARALMLTAEDVQLMRGKQVAAFWFSDRARRIGLPDLSDAPPSTSPQDAETLGRELVESVPRGVTFLHQDLRDATLRSWVIRDGEVHFVATPISSAALYAEIDEFSNALTERTDSLLRHSQRLYEFLFTPVRAYASGSDLLVYSPAAVLRGVPVAALHDGRKFVIETRAVAVVRDVAGFAARLGSTRATTGPVLVTLPDPGPGAPSLPGARTEGRAFLRIYSARSVPLFGAQATPESFLAIADQYDVIHIGGHGRTDRRPLQNAIEFGSKRLRAYDVLGLRLTRHPVIVLAGCRTDDEIEGRATLSLARAFVSAGASAVVGSLWNVDDDATARIMAEFHQHLSNGVPPARALCLTQRSAITRQVALSSWAAFQTQM